LFYTSHSANGFLSIKPCVTRVTNARKINSGRRALDSLPPFPAVQSIIWTLNVQRDIKKKFSTSTSYKSEIHIFKYIIIFLGLSTCTDL
jgi:hypothetical protein